MLFFVFNAMLLAGLVFLFALSLLRAGKLSPRADAVLGSISILTLGVVALGAILVDNLVVLLILVVWGVVIAARSSAERDSLLWTLATAAEQGLPLGPGASAFAEECRGRYRQRVLRLTRLLNDGSTLPESLEVLPRVLSEEATLAARVGSDAGILARALREVAERRTYRTPMWYTFGLRILYLLGVLVFTQCVLLFSMMFVLPKLQRILSDFGSQVTGIAGLLIDSSDWFAYNWPISAVVIGVQGLLGLYLLLWMMGWLTWDLPLVRRFFRRLDLAMVLRMLALSIEAGKPLTEPLDSLARHFPRRGVRKRLSRVAQDVRAGQAWPQSFHRHGLVDRRDVAVLESASRVGNVAWALRETADSSERRLAFRLHAWSQVLYPVCVLLVALPIGLTATAFLLPIIEVLRSVA